MARKEVGSRWWWTGGRRPSRWVPYQTAVQRLKRAGFVEVEGIRDMAEPILYFEITSEGLTDLTVRHVEEHVGRRQAFSVFGTPGRGKAVIAVGRRRERVRVNGYRWRTIRGHRILVSPDGRIGGGDVPRSWQGRRLQDEPWRRR